MNVTRQEAAALLRRYAVLLDLLESEPFRARAFDNAARALENQTEPLDILLTERRLAGIKGIGKGVAAAIEETAARGTFTDLESAAAQVPEGVFDLLRVEGLGPKKARTLWREAGVASLDGLAAALDSGRLLTLAGFGAKTVERFRTSLEFLRETQHRHLRHRARSAADALRQKLAGIEGIGEFFVGGSLRRACETVGDLDVLAITPAGRQAAVYAAIAALRDFKWQAADDRLYGDCGALPVELSVVAAEASAWRKIVITGSAEHVAALERRARANRIDLERANGASFADETAIYARLDLAYVPPELREAGLTLRDAGAEYPAPVRRAELRGMLHCHTTASDGHHTLREMAAAARAAGYEYLGIADHSQAAAYAGGLSPERVRQQWREIDALNAELSPFRILKGTEVDILPDGTLDFEDELLAGFDFVVASVHSGFSMSEDVATERLCRALENPHVDFLGHPTGRLLLERPGYRVNHERLIACAAAYGKGIELNCNPHRLDLDWRWFALCETQRVPVPLCPDAHDIGGMEDIDFGVDVAAKGPLTAGNCPSAWSADRFLEWCRMHSS